MRLSAAFPSKYIRATDLDGRTVIVTISHVSIEDIGDGDLKPVVYFEGKEKGLVLNVTNGKFIAELFGDEMDDWAGNKIVLYEAMVQFRDKMVPATRVRAAQNKAQSKTKKTNDDPRTSAEIIDDEIPF